MGHCDDCDVDIPDGVDSKQLHESGQKHVKMVANRQKMADLGERSVFLKWKSGDSLKREDLVAPLVKLGRVERLLFRPESHFAIVEFRSSDTAAKMLLNDTFVVANVSLTVEKRKVDYKPPVIEKLTIVPEDVISSIDAKTFSDQVDQVIDKIVIPTSLLEHRQKSLLKIEEELKKYFINPKVFMFGSSVTSIGTLDSDIDSCLELLPPEDYVPDLNRSKFDLMTVDATTITGRKCNMYELQRLSPADRTRFVCKIINEIRKDVGWIGHQRPVLDARCPVVRFIADKKLKIDLSVFNGLGRAKSLYLRELIEKNEDGNLRRLLVAYRFWALSHNLLTPMPNQHDGHFNAYMLNLIMLGFLMNKGLVPSFKHSVLMETADSWRIDFEVEKFDLSNICICTLFREFFLWFISFDFSNHIVTLLDEGIIAKQLINDCDAKIKDNFKISLINVMDPLERSHNVCQNVCEKLMGRMRREMTYSLAALKKNKNSYVDMLVNPEKSQPSSPQMVTEGFCVLFKSMPEATCESVRDVVTHVIEDILGMEKDLEPVVKRRKDENDCSATKISLKNYFVRHQLWVGRRAVKKQTMESHPGVTGLELEVAISRRLKDMANNQVSLQTDITIIPADGDLRIYFHRLSGDNQDFQNMAHFLEQLLQKYHEEVSKSLLRGSCF